MFDSTPNKSDFDGWFSSQFYQPKICLKTIFQTRVTLYRKRAWSALKKSINSKKRYIVPRKNNYHDRSKHVVGSFDRMTFVPATLTPWKFVLKQKEICFGACSLWKNNTQYVEQCPMNTLWWPHIVEHKDVKDHFKRFDPKFE